MQKILLTVKPILNILGGRERTQGPTHHQSKMWKLQLIELTNLSCKVALLHSFTLTNVTCQSKRFKNVLL